jgi:flagellar motor switch protein FliG
MGNRRAIVVTTYGHDNIIDNIAVSSFESSGNSYCDNQNSDAKTYCDTINSLALKGDSWVFAKILSENTQYALDVFLPLRFSDVIIKLDDRAVQKIIRKIDSQELAKALKAQDDIVQEKIFTNMSKRASQMLIEDMQFMGPIWIRDVEESQKKILDTIHHLIQCGEIVNPYDKGETAE